MQLAHVPVSPPQSTKVYLNYVYAIADYQVIIIDTKKNSIIINNEKNNIIMNTE